MTGHQEVLENHLRSLPSDYRVWERDLKFEELMKIYNPSDFEKLSKLRDDKVGDFRGEDVNLALEAPIRTVGLIIISELDGKSRKMLHTLKRNVKKIVVKRNLRIDVDTILPKVLDELKRNDLIEIKPFGKQGDAVFISKTIWQRDKASRIISNIY